MNMFSNVGSYLLGVIVTVAGLLALYFKGKSEGKQEAVEDHTQQVQKQALEAAEVVEEVRREVDTSGDEVLRKEAADKWVRK